MDFILMDSQLLVNKMKKSHNSWDKAMRMNLLTATGMPLLFLIVAVAVDPVLLDDQRLRLGHRALNRSSRTWNHIRVAPQIWEWNLLERLSITIGIGFMLMAQGHWADIEVPSDSFDRSSLDSRTCYPWRATNSSNNCITMTGSPCGSWRLKSSCSRGWVSMPTLSSHPFKDWRRSRLTHCPCVFHLVVRLLPFQLLLVNAFFPFISLTSYRKCNPWMSCSHERSSNY